MGIYVIVASPNNTFVATTRHPGTPVAPQRLGPSRCTGNLAAMEFLLGIAVFVPEMVHLLLVIGLALGGSWFLHGRRWAAQLPRGFRQPSSHDGPDSTGTPLNPPQHPHGCNSDSNSTDTSPVQPASTQPPRGPDFHSGSSDEEPHQPGEAAPSPAPASVPGVPMPSNPPLAKRKKDKFIEVSGVTFRVNEASHETCDHANLEISAFNSWGINVRCTCSLGAHARWKGVMKQDMPRDELKSTFCSALSAGGF